LGWYLQGGRSLWCSGGPLPPVWTLPRSGPLVLFPGQIRTLLHSLAAGTRNVPPLHTGPRTSSATHDVSGWQQSLPWRLPRPWLRSRVWRLDFRGIRQGRHQKGRARPTRSHGPRAGPASFISCSLMPHPDFLPYGIIPPRNSIASERHVRLGISTLVYSLASSHSFHHQRLTPHGRLSFFSWPPTQPIDEAHDQ
jgi:hypothetical protein